MRQQVHDAQTAAQLLGIGSHFGVIFGAVVPGRPHLSYKEALHEQMLMQCFFEGKV